MTAVRQVCDWCIANVAFAVCAQPPLCPLESGAHPSFGDDWCGHCGRPLEDSLCPVHDVPDLRVSEEAAWRIKDEAKYDFDE